MPGLTVGQVDRCGKILALVPSMSNCKEALCILIEVFSSFDLRKNGKIISTFTGNVKRRVPVILIALVSSVTLHTSREIIIFGYKGQDMSFAKVQDDKL